MFLIEMVKHKSTAEISAKGTINKVSELLKCRYFLFYPLSG